MIDIYTDGACEPNPGSGGWGFVLFEGGEEILSRFGGSLETTNNIMEMTAVLAALELALLNALSVQRTRIYCDSQYVVKGCNEWRHTWARKGWSKQGLKNKDLWKTIAEAHDAFPCKIEWVRGHRGVPGNERADELAANGRAYVMARAMERELQ